MKTLAILAFAVAGGNALVSAIETIHSLMALVTLGHDAFMAVPRAGPKMEWAIAMATCGFILIRLGKEPKP
jgi:hypothetical protein